MAYLELLLCEDPRQPRAPLARVQLSFTDFCEAICCLGLYSVSGIPWPLAQSLGFRGWGRRRERFAPERKGSTEKSLQSLPNTGCLSSPLWSPRPWPAHPYPKDTQAHVCAQIYTCMNVHTHKHTCRGEHIHRPTCACVHTHTEPVTEPFARSPFMQ